MATLEAQTLQQQKTRSGYNTIPDSQELESESTVDTSSAKPNSWTLERVQTFF